MWMCLLLLAFTWVQGQTVPEKISYQGVIRDASGNLLSNSAIAVKVSILNGNSVVYTETHRIQTNANGLISLEVGGGIAAQGSISTINWSMGNYFIRTQVDPAGGDNYTIDGKSQLLSVPYALYAKGVDYQNVSNKPKLADVATSGDYRDLENIPNLKDVAISGDYKDLENTPSFADVAASGSYKDLKDIPQKLSDFVNDRGYITQENVQLKYDASLGLGYEGGNSFVALPIPKKVSELDNDKNYASKEQITAGLDLNVRKGDNNQYSLQLSDGEEGFGSQQIIQLPSKVSELTNDVNYITQESQVLKQEGNVIQLWSTEKDGVLQGQAAIPTKVSEFENDENYVKKDNLRIKLINDRLLRLVNAIPDQEEILAEVTLPQATTGGTILPNGAVKGDLLYWNGDQGWIALPVGLEGQILSVGSSGLEWKEPAMIINTDKYEVGEVFSLDAGATKGVIVKVDEVARTGLLIALGESQDIWSNDLIYQGTSDRVDGNVNQRLFNDFTNKNEYPAFNYAGQKDGWYLPSIEEMQYIARHQDEINQYLSKAGGTQLNAEMYWSSTEIGKDAALSVSCIDKKVDLDVEKVKEGKYFDKNTGIELTAVPEAEFDSVGVDCWIVENNLPIGIKYTKGLSLWTSKTKSLSIRAVRKLSWTEITSKPAEEITRYNVGDVYYDENHQPLGIVYQTTDKGVHGRILSYKVCQNATWAQTQTWAAEQAGFRLMTQDELAGLVGQIERLNLYFQQSNLGIPILKNIYYWTDGVGTATSRPVVKFVNEISSGTGQTETKAIKEELSLTREEEDESSDPPSKITVDNKANCLVIMDF